LDNVTEPDEPVAPLAKQPELLQTLTVEEGTAVTFVESFEHTSLTVTATFPVDAGAIEATFSVCEGVLQKLETTSDVELPPA
jgi:hypothetical protein